MTRPGPSAPIILSLVLVVFSGYVGYARQFPCTDAEARRALDEAVTLRNWDALYKSYRLYRQCDDGAIGEGYSESVARILVDHWNTLPQLDRLTKKETGFLRFVVRHIDATLNMSDVEKIRNNATMQCPTGLRTLCGDLRKQTDAALKEDASPQ
jgi:hypothetical protein